MNYVILEGREGGQDINFYVTLNQRGEWESPNKNVIYLNIISLPVRCTRLALPLKEFIANAEQCLLFLLYSETLSYYIINTILVEQRNLYTSFI